MFLLSCVDIITDEPRSGRKKKPPVDPTLDDTESKEATVPVGDTMASTATTGRSFNRHHGNVINC